MQSSKRGFSLILILSLSVILLWCTLPQNPTQNVSNAKCEISTGGSVILADSETQVLLSIHLPNLFDSIIIHFGSTQEDNKQIFFETSSIVDTIVKLKHVFKEDGNRTIIATAYLGTETRAFSYEIQVVRQVVLSGNGAIGVSGTPTVGIPFSLYVGYTGTAPVQFLWFKNNLSILNSDNDSLAFTALSLADNGTYTCIVKNQYGSDTSLNYTIQLGQNNVPVFQNSKAIQVSGPIKVDSSLFLYVSVTGSPLPTLTWYKNKTIINGKTVDTLAFSSLTVHDTGTYWCIAENSNGKDTTGDFRIQFDTVPAGSNTSKMIVSFTFGDSTITNAIDTAKKTIAVTVPYNTVVKTLAPTIIHTGTSISPASGVVQDFSDSVIYTVTAEDKSIQSYIVKVNIAPNTAKAITGFTFTNPVSTSAIIDTTKKTVVVTVPYNTVVKTLAPMINHSGVSISPASGVVQDFSDSVIYTVTAEDTSIQSYVVKVNIAPNTAKAITDFTFTNPVSTSTIIDTTKKTVVVTVPYNTVVKTLVPAVSHTGASISPASGVEQDFSTAKTYTVTAADGSTQAYSVTVILGLSTTKTMSSFTFSNLAVASVIDSVVEPKTVAVTVPYLTDRRALVATFSTGGSSVKVSGVLQVSGSTPNNFSNPVAYTVTAADGSTQDYVVTVTTATPGSNADLSALSVSAGTLSPNFSATTLDYTVSIANSVTSIIVIGTRADQNATISVVGTPQNLVVGNNTITVKVTAQDGITEKSYTVTVTRAPKVVTLLAIPGVAPPITGATPVTTITATEYTGTVSWSGSPVTFASVTAYTATITLTANAGFTFSGVTANAFKVAGATATNAANTWVVTAVFPATDPTVVNFASLSSNGTPNSVTTTELTLTFDINPIGLTIDNITVTGATKGTLTGSGTTRILSISGITVADGQNVEVKILSSPAGFTISPLSRAVTISSMLTMISVPAGSFQRDDTVANISAVSAFRMSAYEITRAQFKDIMGIDPSDETRSSGELDPVKNTNWYHAIAFCNKLSIKEGLTAVYSVSGVTFSTLTFANIPISNNADWNAATITSGANGYRLPTEMEWMWAAMGGTAGGGTVSNTGYSKAFAGSNETNAIGDFAVFGYWGNEDGRTTTSRSASVGSKNANELGLYDMSGNVWEWCWDWYDLYPAGTATNYLGAAATTSRVMRGGSWYGYAPRCAVAGRSQENPSLHNSDFGFRVVRP